MTRALQHQATSRGFRATPTAQMAALGRRWVRPGIVLGVLVLAAAVGFLATKRNPLLAAAAASAPLAMVALSGAAPHRGLFPPLILFTALFIPFSLPTGEGSRLALSLVLTTGFIGLVVLRMMTVERRVYLPPSPVNLPLLGWTGIVLVSLIWSNVYRDPQVFVWSSFPFVQGASALVMIMLPAAYLMVVGFVDNLRFLKAMVAIMVVAGALALIPRYGLANLPVNTGGMFGMWVISLSFGLGLFHKRLQPPQRLGLFLLTGAHIVWGFVFNISWLAGWLPGLVAMGVLAYRHSKKLAAVLMLSVVVVSLANWDFYFEDVLSRETSESGYTRLAAWAQNWQVTREHWLFGTGPAGYAVYYMTYFPREAMATHSNYLDILSQSGVAGSAFFVWFFGVQTWLSYKLCRRVKGRGDFVEALANSAFAGTIACIVIMGFGDWLIPFAYTQGIGGFDYAVYNWLFMGTALALERLT